MTLIKFKQHSVFLSPFDCRSSTTAVQKHSTQNTAISIS